MAKKPKASKAVAIVAGAPGGDLAMRLGIEPLEVYRVPDRRPAGEGPWAGEADKASWIDRDTGLPCIMLRGQDGALRGYVGVGPSHPLFGASVGALPTGPSISVHGGINYAKPCVTHAPPSISVCHVHDRRASAAAPAEDPVARAVAALPADLWWFGFSCDHSYDLVPGTRPDDFLQIENGRVYRDEAYVVRETTRLASQLGIVGRGEALPPTRPVPGEVPPRFLDPFRRNGR